MTAPKDLTELNKMLIMTDLFDDPDDGPVQIGVAINADDLDAFIKDVEDLAVEKYGGKRFGDLLDDDPEDITNTAAQRQYFVEQFERVMEQANEALNGGDDK